MFTSRRGIRVRNGASDDEVNPPDSTIVGRQMLDSGVAMLSMLQAVTIYVSNVMSFFLYMWYGRQLNITGP